jgi:DNA-binding beta-propeller fold protein YncE
VSVIDTRSGDIDEALEGFEWPYRILITPVGNTVLIPDLRRNVLRFVDRNERRDIGVMEFPSGGPQGITLSGDAKTAYLSLSQRNRIAVIDMVSREVTGYIDTGAGPDGIGFSPIRVAQ